MHSKAYLVNLYDYNKILTVYHFTDDMQAVFQAKSILIKMNQYLIMCNSLDVQSFKRSGYYV